MGRHKLQQTQTLNSSLKNYHLYIFYNDVFSVQSVVSIAESYSEKSDKNTEYIWLFQNYYCCLKI